MRIELFWIVVVALFWGGWPLVARSSGMGGPFSSLVLSVASLVPIALATIWQGDAARLSAAEVLRLAAAGGMMGVGLVAFNLVVNSDIDTSVTVPMMDAAMLMVTTLGAIYFFQEGMSLQKVVGLSLLLAGIAVLRPS